MLTEILRLNPLDPTVVLITRYQDLLVQDTANTPYWGNPATVVGFLGMASGNGNFNAADFFLGKRNSVPSSMLLCLCYNAAKLYGPFTPGDQTRLTQDFPWLRVTWPVSRP